MEFYTGTFKKDTKEVDYTKVDTKILLGLAINKFNAEYTNALNEVAKAQQNLEKAKQILANKQAELNKLNGYKTDFVTRLNNSDVDDKNTKK